MNSLVQLPLKVADFLARTSLRIVQVAAEAAAERLQGRRSDQVRVTPEPAASRMPTAPRPAAAPRAPRAPRTDPTARSAPAPAPPAPPAPAAPARPAPAPERPAPAPVRPAAEPAPPEPPVAAAPMPPPAPAAPAPPPAAVPDVPAVPPIEVVPDLTPGQAARIREEQREAEASDESPGAEVHVDEPWNGYASMNAPEIIDRLGASDEAVKAVVLLYERTHRARKTVMRAAGG
ncbi:MAG TPA: hypothetical protein VGC59_11780 [Solirubrobacteraceae bacterium]